MTAFAKRYPTLVATLVYSLLIAVIFWPVWQGQLLMSPVSDQVAGYSFRAFAAEHFKHVGGFPLWNPYIFGGMPFLQNTTNGDTFYPTAFLRLILPVGTAMALGFLIHLVLAGSFTFSFLRTLGIRAEAAFIGGLSYMLTGMVISQVSPGHDGKLFVSALTPLALNFLCRAVTRNDWRQYVYLGAVIGFSFLTPHYQMTYYLLMAVGFFWIFLNFFDEPRVGRAPWVRSFGWFVAALALGFAVDAVQMAPFAHYIGSTGRAAAGSSSTGWAYATSYAMPIEESLNVLWPSFSGYTLLGTYWGQNGIKLHSEYMGGVTLILATLGFFLRERKRLTLFFAFLGVYAALFSFGGHTPFYHIPYAILPGIKLTRAPGQIFFLASLAVAVLAGFGAEYLLRARERREAVGKGALIAWSVILVGGALLAFGGGFAAMIESMAPPQYADMLPSVYGQLSLDAVRVLVFGALAIGVIIAFSRGRLSAPVSFIALSVLVGLDLWSVEKRYINWLPPENVTFAPDEVVRTLRQDTTIFRVLSPGTESYAHNYFATQKIRDALGYQGTELHRYDELMGGKGEWRNLGNPAVLRLVTAKYLVIGQALPPNPMLTQVGNRPLATHDGAQAWLYRFNVDDPYAYVVPTAVKIPDDQALAVITDPRSGFDPRKAILVPPDAKVGMDPKDVRSLAPADSTPVHVVRGDDDVIRFALGAPAPANSYLFVSENWYPDWRATVDGKPTDVVRAQSSLIAIPLAAGARSVELRVAEASYGTFRWVTIAALAFVLVTVVSGAMSRRRAAHGV
ncbi:MAG: hypothetical protein ACJ79K_04770 [Gemmatimonadaceae bacterium]